MDAVELLKNVIAPLGTLGALVMSMAALLRNRGKEDATVASTANSAHALATEAKDLAIKAHAKADGVDRTVVQIEQKLTDSITTHRVTAEHLQRQMERMEASVVENTRVNLAGQEANRSMMTTILEALSERAKPRRRTTGG